MGKRNAKAMGSTAVMDTPVETAVDETWNEAGEFDKANEVAAPEENGDIVAPEPALRLDHEELIEAARTGAVREFDTDDLIADPNRNGRFKERKITDPDVKELAGQIREEGQLQAGQVLYGLDGQLYVNFGTGRFLALQLLNEGFDTSARLPFKATVTLEEIENPAHALVKNAMENWGRKELTPLDKAKVVGMFLAAGWKQSQICEKLNQKKAHISMLAAASAWPDEIKALIAEDKISLKAVYDLGIKDNEKLSKEVTKLVAEADATGAKKVTTSKTAASRAKRAEKEDAEGDGKTTTKKKQRTPRQILEFVTAEATDATAKKYGDKKLVAKLTLFGKFVSGMSEGTFLKNLAAI